MPTLKQLSCHIEWANPSVPFKEYGITYGDGLVECFISIPAVSIPFSIHLQANGYIAPGLAMFVYMDGVYQCNRNRDNILLPSRSKKQKPATKSSNISFRVRQREERLPNVQPMPSRLEIDPSDFEQLGEITVFVLRCESRRRRDDAMSDGSLTPDSAMAFGPKLDDCGSISSGEFIICTENSMGDPHEDETTFGGIFDGPSDHPCSCHSCQKRAQQSGTTRRRGHRRCDKSRISSRVHWEDEPPYLETSGSERDQDSDIHYVPPDFDRIRRGYQHCSGHNQTNPISTTRPERQEPETHCCNFHGCHGPEGDKNPTREPRRQHSSGHGSRRVRERRVSRDPSPTSPQQVDTKQDHQGCAPSIVLNVNPANAIPEAYSTLKSACSRCSRHATESQFDNGGCYTISNGERVRRHCHHHQTCCNHNQSNVGPLNGSNNNACQQPTTEPNGNNDTSWDTSNDNQNQQPDNQDSGNQNPQGDDNNNAGWDTQNNNQDSSNVNWANDASGNQGGNDNYNSNDQNWNNNNDQNVGDGHWNNNNDQNAANGHWSNNNSGQPNYDAGGNQGTHWNGGQDGGNGNYNNGNPDQNPQQPIQNWNNNNNQGQIIADSNVHIYQPPRQRSFWAPPQHSQNVPAIITPLHREQESDEPPLYTVPEHISRERSLSHQVQVGKSASYSHKIRVPIYMDTMEEPYAKFVFRYRMKGKQSPFDMVIKHFIGSNMSANVKYLETIEKHLNIQLEQDIDSERKILQSLPREQLLNQLLYAHGLLQQQNAPHQPDTSAPIQQQWNAVQPQPQNSLQPNSMQPPLSSPIIVPPALPGHHNIHVHGNQGAPQWDAAHPPSPGPHQQFSQPITTSGPQGNESFANALNSKLHNEASRQQGSGNNNYGNNGNTNAQWNSGNQGDQSGGQAANW
ncbi:hypothetical protein FQN57_005801 [Myotisia sp. PD_48]|nr:hypothetical protein FQN57_005801 [Myotisia sp. PD_48]